MERHLYSLKGTSVQDDGKGDYSTEGIYEGRGSVLFYGFWLRHGRICISNVERKRFS